MVRDLVKKCALNELRVVVIFIVGLGVVFCLSIALVRFMVIVNA